jgi:hypothetical protein
LYKIINQYLQGDFLCGKYSCPLHGYNAQLF